MTRPALLLLALAAALPLGAQIPASLTCGVPHDARLEPEAQPAVFFFQAAEPNEAVAIRAIPTSDEPPLSLTLVLRNAMTNRIVNPRASSLFGSTGAEYQLDDAGEYRLEVRSRTAGVGGTFRLFLTRLNGPCDTATLACGTPAAAQIGSPLVIHTYDLPGSAGDVYSIRLVKTTSDPTADQKSASFALAIFDPAGQLETVVENGVRKSLAFATTSWLQTELRFTSTAPRRLVVWESSTGKRTGTYSLTAARLNGPCRSRTADCGAVAEASIAQPVEVHTYTLNATSGDVFLVRLMRADTASALRPVVSVYDSTGAWVQPVSGSDATRYAFTAPRSGPYTVLVSDDPRYGGAQTGPYALSFARLNRPCNSSPLECGAVADGRIDGPLRFATYAVQAEAGDVFLLRMMRTDTASAFKPRAEIYGPDGTRLNVTSTTDLARAAFTAPAAGAYTILALDGADGTRSGAFSIALARLNRPCNAAPLGCATLATGSISGPLRFAAYSYTAQPGDAFTVRMLDPGDTLQESIEVYDPQGNPAGTAVAGNFPAVDIVNAAAGPYTILAMDAGRTPGQGPFALQFFRTRDACAPAAAPGATLQGLVTGPAPWAAWTLSAEAADSLLVRTASRTPGFTAAMELFDPSGARVATSTYSISAAAPAAGPYLLVVGASSPRNTGAYALSWQPLNRPAETRPLTCGATTHGALSPAAQFHYYTAPAEAGDLFRLLLTRVTDGFTPQVELYDSAGRRLTGNPTGITRRTADAGAHLVLVSPSTATGETGAYALYFQKPDRPCQVAAVTCGQTVLRTADAPGHAAAFTFEGASGLRTVLRIPPRFGAFSPFVELYDPAGTLLQSGAATQIARDLAPGRYTLLVRDRTGLNTGTYRVSVQRDPDACPVDDPESPVVRLRRPTGGEVLSGGLPFRLNWESDDNIDVVSHEIALSTDGDATFTILAAGLGGTAQSYDWYIPADIQPTRDARLRITAADAAGNTAADTSEALSIIGSGFEENTAAEFTYDALNRLVQVRYAGGTVVDYTWDREGNLLEVRVTAPQP